VCHTRKPLVCSSISPTAPTMAAPWRQRHLADPNGHQREGGDILQSLHHVPSVNIGEPLR